MLVGKHFQNIDAKGRVSIPAKFRASLGESFVVAANPVKGEKCVNIYTIEEWNAFMGRISELEAEVRRMMMRFMQSASAECELDSQGRVVIPSDIRSFAGLTKEIVVVGAQTKIEIWSKERWDVYNNDKIDMDVVSNAMMEIGM